MGQSILDDVDTTQMCDAKIKVIGVGGAGGNAVQEMINSSLIGVQFICANTDVQALNKNQAPYKVQLGEKLTRGLGAGANPEVGKNAAIESVNAIRDAIGDADMVFITAGMGGGTGTGAAPVIAQAAKEMNTPPVVVGVVSKPFTFEGKKRQNTAEDGLRELAQYVDSLIIIPNDRLTSFAPKKALVSAMFQLANDVLLNAVRGISDVIMREGQINLDFADVRTIMLEPGLALMGTGRASGENRAREAAQQAIMSPLLEDVSLESAKGILYNITSSHDITMDEMAEIGYIIHEAAANDPNINIIFGMVYDDNMGDELQVTVIATGIEQQAHIEEIEDLAPANVRPFRTPNAQPQKIKPVQEQPVEEQETRRQGNVWFENRNARPQFLQPRDAARNRHVPGQDTYTYNEDDYDIPAFIKYQAD